MPDNYDVSVNAINVPGWSLLPGADVGSQGTVNVGSTYTVSAGLTINEVPGFASTDHCQVGFGGGAMIVMEVAVGGESKTVEKCITGPEGSTAEMSVDLTAPDTEGVTESVFVTFYGKDSTELVAEGTRFEFETAEEGDRREEETDNYDIDVGAVNTPGGSLIAGRDHGQQATVDAGSSYVISSYLKINDVPPTFSDDHCQDGLNGGASIVMEVATDSGTVSTEECISGPPGNRTEMSVEVDAPTQPGADDLIYVDFYGKESGRYLIDTTVFELETATSDGSRGDLNINDVESTCSVSPDRIKRGETAQASIDLEGDHPGPGSDPYVIQVTLFANGQQIGRDFANITINGGQGVTFDIEDLPVGENDITFELKNLGQ